MDKIKRSIRRFQKELRKAIAYRNYLAFINNQKYFRRWDRENDVLRRYMRDEGKYSGINDHCCPEGRGCDWCRQSRLHSTKIKEEAMRYEEKDSAI